MKALFFTLLLFAGAFLAYDYYLAEPGTKIVFKSLNTVKKKVDAGPTFVSAPQENNQPATPTEANAEKTTTSPAPATTVTASPAKPAEEQPKVEKSGFTPPKYDPIEVLTANWAKIPASAFPREIHLKQDVQFKMGAGSAKVAAGAAASALGFENGMLTIAPTETSPARATVPLDATDLKSVLNTVYEDWKPKRTAWLREIFLKKQATLKAQGVVVAPTGSLDETGKPVRNADGTYPILLASMASGQVTEVTTKNVHRWGEPTPAKIEGKDGWSIKVNYDANSIFGPMPVEAQALVVNGKVKGWYYLGSGEEVP